MSKLWQKSWKLNKQVEAFETSDDLLLDQKLVWADVAGSIAHAMMLYKIGILSKKELKQAMKGLLDIHKQDSKGEFLLTIGDEDIHTKIENFLTDHYGSVGKKIHTGRSRNDQVSTAIHLYVKEALLRIWAETIQSASVFLSFAKKYEFLPMPGYTHMQKAMPSSVGLWASSFVESLLSDCMNIKHAFALVDQSPLGSAAGYGVPIALDREYTANLLGFNSVINNSLYSQNSKGKVMAFTVASLISLMQTVNKFATDVLLFTTGEFGYFKVADELTTGSSIMPQKKNIDCAELLRSKFHVVQAHYNEILGIFGNLPSGYNRDSQGIKKPLFDALTVSSQSVSIAALLVKNLMPNSRKLASSLTPELFAAHKVLTQVQKGKSFRDAYHSATWDQIFSSGQVQKMLQQSTHLGGTGNLGLQILQKKLAEENKVCHNATKQFITAMARLGVVPVSTSKKGGELNENKN